MDYSHVDLRFIRKPKHIRATSVKGYSIERIVCNGDFRISFIVIIPKGLTLIVGIYNQNGAAFEHWSLNEIFEDITVHHRTNESH